MTNNPPPTMPDIIWFTKSGGIAYSFHDAQKLKNPMRYIPAKIAEDYKTLYEAERKENEGLRAALVWYAETESQLGDKARTALLSASSGGE